uniref:Anoctamin n=1 Tax=Echinostoma caproni TaxID=27848 RepID=A0A183A3D4_9TREM
LAHLMTRVEALASAPPGALLISFQIQPNCWKMMASVYPEERLSDVIQEQVAAGFIPLVQVIIPFAKLISKWAIPVVNWNFYCFFATFYDQHGSCFVPYRRASDTSDSRLAANNNVEREHSLRQQSECVF